MKPSPLKRALLPFLLLLCLTLSLGCSGCAGTTPGPAQQTTTLDQAQDAATKTVLAMGDILISAPNLLKAARQSGKLTKADYNSSVEIYNQALASYTLLNQALQAAITAGKDPAGLDSYSIALAKFLVDRNLLNNFVIATGGK